MAVDEHDEVSENGDDCDLLDGPSDKDRHDDGSEITRPMKSENNRLNTFHNWPSTAAVRPHDLARQGFYYTESGDRVKCVFCGVVIKHWAVGDKVETEHRKFSRGCPFLNGENVGNVPSSREPRHPEYRELSVRVESYSKWPSSATQRPEELAKAGFFYKGNLDLVTCFFCGVHVRNWEADDIPLEEHMKWYPSCGFCAQFRQEGEAGNLDYYCGKFPAVQKVLEMGYSRDILESYFRGQTNQAESILSDVNSLVDAIEKHKEQVGPAQATSKTHPPPAPMKNLREPSGHPPPGPLFSQPAPAATAGTEASGDRTLCKICMDREVEMTFQPCGHLVCCQECAQPLKECPVCRRPIKSALRTYLT